MKLASTIMSTVLSSLLAISALAENSPEVPQSPAEQVPGFDLPHEAPVSSTGFVCLLKDSFAIVAVVITYPDGKVVRFANKMMHGFTVEMLEVYADSAKDSKIYSVQCAAPQIT